MSRPVAEFYSSFGINVRLNDLKKVDRYLGLVERRLGRFQQKLNKSLTLNLSNFTINRRALRASLGNALDRASKDVTFEISRFAVNDRNLRAALLRSSRSVGRTGSTTRDALLQDSEYRRYLLGRQIGERGYRSLGYRSELERELREFFRLGERYRTPYPREPRIPHRSSVGLFGDGRQLLYAGGSAGLIARQGIGAVPLIGGAYGLMRLNRAHQEIFVAPLTTQAVVQAQGFSEEEGLSAFNWLKRQAQEIGFSYMDSAQDFNQILSNALGAGLGIDDTQEIFKGFNEYQTAMGITPYRRKLINNAMSQMLG